MNESTAKRKAALWVLVVFVLGAALGGVFGYFYASRVNAAPRTPQLTESQRTARRAERVKQLSQELGLTPDQSQQLATILAQLHEQYKTAQEQSDAQIKQLHQKGRDQIRAILTPEQKPRFEAFLQRLDAERRRNAAASPSR